MKSYEEQYFDGLQKIMDKGVVCESGRQSTESHVVRTKRTWGVDFEVDLYEEFPVLKSKHVAVKSAIREILWIMCKQSNNINDLVPHIWDKWANEDGGIGKSYGYQVHKPVFHNKWHYHDQASYVLGLLEKDPSSRHGLIDLWCPGELSQMNLVPCCHVSQFAILNGRLNCMLTQRSGDYLVGVPFNTTQYAFLTIAFARHLGVEPGILLHHISDAHVYESQYGNFDTGEQTESFKTLMQNNAALMSDRNPTGVRYMSSKPAVSILSEGTDFFSIGDNDFMVHNYKVGENCFPDITFEVEV